MDARDVPNSVQLFAAAQKVLATGVSSGMRRKATPLPLYFDRADGPYFFDVDGRRLLDYTLAWGPLILGSNHAGINAAIVEQLSRSYTFGAQHELELRLASLITTIVPGVEQVIFSNTGSEAVQAAIRIARAITGRDKIVKFEGHYHGWMNNVLVSYHPATGGSCETQPTCGGQPRSEYGQTLVLPWNDVAALRELLVDRGHEIACVLTEPLLANSGCCEPKSGFLQSVIDLCREHGAVSVFDEVITGFRVALGGARELYQLEPDLSVYGKAIAGGFSLSAVGGRANMFDVLRDGRTIHAGTYNGNSICLAAAYATLQALAEPGVFEGMKRHGRELRNAIENGGVRNGLPLALSGVETVFSLHWGLETGPRDYRDTLRASLSLRDRFQMAMLDRGVLLLPDGRWYVGASHDDEALTLAKEAIDVSMQVLLS